MANNTSRRSISVDPDTGEILAPPEGEEFSEARLTLMLLQAYDVGRQAKNLDHTYRTLRQLFEDWLAKNPGEQLRDGESGIVARLVEPVGERCDLAELAKRNIGALGALAERGLLSLDTTGFRRQERDFREGVIVRDYIYPDPRKAYCKIEKEK